METIKSFRVSGQSQGWIVCAEQLPGSFHCAMQITHDVYLTRASSCSWIANFSTMPWMQKLWLLQHVASNIATSIDFPNYLKQRPLKHSLLFHSSPALPRVYKTSGTMAHKLSRTIHKSLFFNIFQSCIRFFATRTHTHAPSHILRKGTSNGSTQPPATFHLYPKV